MALVRTDYGLIYNTDGSLCATLLPEGGVAVDKPTTNYTDAKTPPTLLVPADWGVEQVGPYKWKIYAKKDNPGVGDQYNRIALFAGQYGAMANEPVTHSAYVVKNTDNLYVEAFGFRNIDVNKDGNRIWRTIAYTATWTHRQVVSCTNPSQIKLGDYIIVDMPQLEASSHPTAFADGSRPAGRLSYPGDKINIDHTTWHFDWKPFQDTNSMTAQVTYPVIFAVGGYSRNSMVLWFYGQQITLMIRGATDTSWSALPSWTPPPGWYQPGKKYKVTVQIIDKDTFKVFIDGQKIIETTISDPFTASVANQKISVGNFNTNEGFANAVYYNLRMVHDRYVSEEEILTWHSLDAPFFDPREITTAELAALQEAKQYADQKAAEDIDTSKRKVYTTGVTIGAKGLVVDKNGVDQVAVGDISGREWKGSPLPSGTFGLWAPDGFIAVSDVASVQINDVGGTTFTGISWETIPGLEATLLVPVGTKLLIYLSSTIVTQMSTANIHGTFGANFRLLLNGSVLPGTERWIQRWRAADGFPSPWQAEDSLCIVTVHEATSQTNRVTVQWQAHNNSWVAMFFRILGILALRR